MMQPVHRTDHRIDGDRGLKLAVRRVVVEGSGGLPVVLVHGARAGGVASFDLEANGGSLAEDLARAGCRVFVMDARGYGGSDRPEEMNQPSSAHPPLVRSVEVVRDIAAVVDWVCRETDSQQIGLLGWATGGHWCGYYASLYPERVSHLVLYNTLYGGTIEHPSLGSGSGLEDPQHPGRFNRDATGAWRTSDGASLLGTWNNSIPVEDCDRWRDPAVAAAYVETAIRAVTGDGAAASFTHPAGALEDSFYLATGRQLWDASFIRARVLIVRSELDFWSRPGDVEMLQAHLIDAAAVRAVTLPDATHFVHLDRPERGRDQFLREVTAFLTGDGNRR